jgi:hypothetical protein
VSKRPRLVFELNGEFGERNGNGVEKTRGNAGMMRDKGRVRVY